MQTSPVPFRNDGSPQLHRPINTGAHFRRPVSLISLTVYDALLNTALLDIISYLKYILQVLCVVDPSLGNVQ
jgi:hypothetical protein